MMYGLTAEHYEARAALKRERQLRKMLKKINRQKTTPLVAEAFAVLIDEQLVWSADFNRIKLSLALLLVAASDLPITEVLAEELLYAKDVVE